VHLTTADSESELYKIAAVHPGAQVCPEENLAATLHVDMLPSSVYQVQRYLRSLCQLTFQ
jgi:hypothetical protein